MIAAMYQQFSDAQLSILKARADRAAGLAQDKEQEELLTVVTIKVGGEAYALPIEAVANVYQGLSITHVPCVPPGVAGIANIRGRVVLVLDLKTLLNIPGEASDTYAVVALADEDLDLALRIDSVRSLETFPAAALSPVPANINLQQAGHIRGLFPDCLALLDLDSIVHDPSFAAVTDSA